ncbi:uncharacterized protein LOC124138923 isoform X1 [Haliotis rufescens]|uniref:uncharacterized protein LOC124138923 isoform X1 n=1 Tax=Haliotis rufescens TaxID=6454 RepID=UPI00201EDBF8|nr:uncharacterized protein LOC124138923 isoform X1 [Haliotis rufescens]
MSSGENISSMSERDSSDETGQNRNCLGHQFDPGSNSKPITSHMNLVDGSQMQLGVNLSDNHQANGYGSMSTSSEDDDFVDAVVNGSVCNGSVHENENHLNSRALTMLTSEPNSQLEEPTDHRYPNGIERHGYMSAPSSAISASFTTSNGRDRSVRPKQPIPPRPKSVQKSKKSCERETLQSLTEPTFQSGHSPSQSMQQHNVNLHNTHIRPPVCMLSDVNNKQNGCVGHPTSNGVYHSPYMPCSRPQSLMLSHIHMENRPANICGNGEFDEPDLFDMVDEGAVCDYDKLLLSDEHNSPSENSRSEEADSEFLNYHFPNTQLDGMAVNCSHCNHGTATEHCQYSADSQHGESFHNSQGQCMCRSNLSASGEVDFDNSDYLKLFDEMDGEHYSAEDEAQETWEDTGDFIDTDLPAQTPGMMSSSAGSSSSSLSEDEGAGGLFHQVSRDSKENDLSSNRLNSDIVPCGILGDRMYGHLKKGGNLCFPVDASMCPSQRLVMESSHHHGVNSSESENGDDYQVDMVLNCDANEVFYEEGAASLEAAASSRNIRPAGLHNGAGSGYCVHNDSVRLEPTGPVHHEHVGGVTADCSIGPSLLCADETVPPGSASCQHSSCPMAVPAGLCVNNLSSISPPNVEPSAGGYHVPVSNFQNDKSNNHQKVFIKFNVTNQERKRTIGHIKRDSSHLGSPISPDDPESSQLEDEDGDLAIDQYEYQHVPEYFQEQMMMIAAEMARTRVNAESGVSEPIYEDIEPLPETEEAGNMAASGLPADAQQKEAAYRKPPLRLTPRRKDRRSSSGGKSGIEKVMIWNEYEAYVLQVKQIATSACGPTAVLNVLKAFDVCVDKDEVCKKIHTNLRDELGSIPTYLFSRAVAGTTAEDLLHGIESLTQGRIRGRFFHFWPSRDVHLLKWLGQWMKKGAVPLATLNLQKGVKTGWTVPDAWHHQMVYGVSSKGVYLTNPLENVAEETVLEQLVSDSILLVRRQDVVNRFRDNTDLGEIIRHPDDRWRTLNVLGQVVNVLRESNMPHPVYRAQLTSHISIPAVYKAGITLFVQGESDLWQELIATSDLPPRDSPHP